MRSTRGVSHAQRLLEAKAFPSSAPFGRRHLLVPRRPGQRLTASAGALSWREG
jgi:hypothetical protein